jgi:hypothetical protein
VDELNRVTKVSERLTRARVAPSNGAALDCGCKPCPRQHSRHLFHQSRWLISESLEREGPYIQLWRLHELSHRMFYPRNVLSALPCPRIGSAFPPLGFRPFGLL